MTTGNYIAEGLYDRNSPVNRPYEKYLTCFKCGSESTEDHMYEEEENQYLCVECHQIKYPRNINLKNKPMTHQPKLDKIMSDKEKNKEELSKLRYEINEKVKACEVLLHKINSALYYERSTTI